ncbi:hypothetical protein ACQ4PT_071022 [Festuca glaucescens]
MAMEESWRPSHEASSSAPDGTRAIWGVVWKSDVPPKVQHFAWKLANDSLPTWRNKQKRNLETTDQCPICGREPEDNFHPFFGCTLAKELWNAMVEEWQIPVLSSVVNTGRDWLLNFLANQTKDIGNKVLMTLWRSWHIRNEIVHDKKPPPLDVSKRFLISYMESILMIKYHTAEDISKGKFILGSGGAGEKDKQLIAEPRWVPPPDGWEKPNTDGSVGPNGNAGAGILLMPLIPCDLLEQPPDKALLDLAATHGSQTPF